MKTLKRLKKFYSKNEMIINIVLFALIARMILLDVPSTFSFDEGFYVPAARDILKGLPDPVPEHPMMAKYMIAGSISLFGDTPVGWRLPSLLLGTAAVFALYFVFRRAKFSERTSLLACFLVATDFLCIEMSRTATLDTCFFAFLIFGLYFLLGKKKYDFLFAGTFFGLAVASKWTALLGIGFAFAYLLATKQLKTKHVLTFLAIPLAVYLLTYAPLIASQGLDGFIGLHMSMYGKLHDMQASSSMASPPYLWPLGQRPLWFTRIKEPAKGPFWFTWLGDVTGEPYGGQVAFGNPLFWWPALFAVLYTCYSYYKKRDRRDLFIVLWFAFTYLPWFLTQRTNVFLYYFLPAVPAYALALSRFFNQEIPGWIRRYAILVLLSLVFFYPILIGLPINRLYFELLRPVIGMWPEGATFMTISS